MRSLATCSLAVVVAIGLQAGGCARTNGFYNDRSTPSSIEDQPPCTACGGTGSALEVGGFAAVLLVTLVLAKLST